MQFTQDPLLADIIAVFAIIVTVITTIITISKTKSKEKRVVYDIVSTKVALDTDKDAQSKIISEFQTAKGIQVAISTLHILKLRIWNAGDADIITNNRDYIQPLKFVFKGASIIEANALSTSPNDFKDDVNIVLNGETMILDPCFDLKSKEEVLIEIYLTNFNENIEGRGRINGVRRIEKSNRGELRYLLRSLVKPLLIAGAIYLSFLSSNFISFISKHQIGSDTTDVVLMILMLFLWLTLVLRSKYRSFFCVIWSLILSATFLLVYILLHSIAFSIFLTMGKQ